MTLLVQSSSESLRTAASSDGSELSITAPPALVAGDMLCIAVSASCLGEVIISGVKDGEPVNDPIAGLSTDAYTSADGKVVFGYSFVATKAAAEAIKSIDEIRISVAGMEKEPQEGEEPEEPEEPAEGEEDEDPAPHGQVTAVIFRVTGADTRRFVEDAKAVTGDLAAEGELTIPSFDPEYRRDNTLLFIASATCPVGSSTPQITAARSTPVASVTANSNSEQGDVLGVTTSVSIRTLSSADPTGTTPVAYSSQPATGLGVALMLRSENRPPVINLAPEWAAEVGREAVVSATVTDPDFTPVSYVWSQIDGPEDVSIGNVYARAFNFTPNLPGIYRFTLRATDVDGGRAELQTSVIVPTGTTGPAGVTAQDGWVDQD